MTSNDQQNPETKNHGQGSKSTSNNLAKDKSSTNTWSWKKVKASVSILKEDATPPNWQMIFLSFVGLYGSAYSITFIFPFLPEMVLFFGYEEEEKGYYSGMMATAMFAGRIFSSYFWGWLSDRIGRKPIIMLNLILIGLTNMGFGFSTNLIMAITFRFVNGLVNGVVGCIKAILYEISDSTNQAVGMASISFGWGLGVVSGPLISGFTSSPATKYPKVFGDVDFFIKYPFFLPSIIATMIQVLACIIVWWKLPETLEKRKPVEIVVNLEDEESKDMLNKDVSSLRKENPINSVSLTDLRERGILKRVPHSDKSFSVSMDDIDFIDSGRNVDDHNKTYGLGILTTSMGDLLYSNPSLHQSKADLNHINQKLKNEQDICEKPKNKEEEKRSKSWCNKIHLFRLLRQKDIALPVALYSIFSFGVIGFDELVTVWASTKTELGGLGFSSDQIGSALGMSALGLIFLQVLIFPKAEAKFGAKRTYGYFCYFLIFSCAALPAVRLCVSQHTVLWILVLLSLGIQKICMTTCFSGTALLINNSVHPSEAGKINGIAMTLAAVARTIAPVAGGSLFSWSVSYGYKIGFPFDVNLAFIMFSFMFYVSNIMCAYVPAHLNKQTHR